LVSSRFFTIFAHKPIKLKVMIVISTRDFRTNQTKFLDMANNGEDIVLKSRGNGSFKLVPVAVENTVAVKRDLMEELKEALQQVKDHMDGKIELKSAESLIDELRNNTL
jgi:antitoxin (DNA-binding transcriptional repressor) of toxin-antitoxin stability system